MAMAVRSILGSSFVASLPVCRCVAGGDSGPGPLAEDPPATCLVRVGAIDGDAFVCLHPAQVNPKDAIASPPSCVDGDWEHWDFLTTQGANAS
ncbi:hypothetical protein BKA66DRAFT_450950 [Pyrenochaeta sp. MPI-SDFR-AT-0127]|nr:hypothetical protein BKA66DRAFT_450950 [Pyrenochaeta sp. MPI-SDFR-AT-0127]